MAAAVLRMTQMVSIAAVISLVSCAPATRAQETAMVQGEVVDLSCYMAQGGRGAEYQACAQRCATKQRITFGILTDSGELFLLLTESNNPDPYEAAKQLAGRRAELTGRVVSKRGVASLIVESAEAW